MEIFMQYFYELLNILARSIVSLLVLLVIAKLTGPRQIAQLTFYDYIIGISIGSIAATMALDIGIPFYHSLFAMIVYFGLAFLMALASSKSIVARRVFTGVPSILIYKGKILEDNLRKQKYDLNDLLSYCRTRGYFNLDDLDYVIMETNGSLSLMPKAGKGVPNGEEMGVTMDPQSLVANVVLDGSIMIHHLHSKGKHEAWLRSRLREMGYPDIDQIFLALLDDNDTITVYLKGQTAQNTDLFE